MMGLLDGAGRRWEAQTRMTKRYKYEVLTVSGWVGSHGTPICDGEFAGGFDVQEGGAVCDAIQVSGILTRRAGRFIIAADMWRKQ